MRPALLLVLGSLTTSSALGATYTVPGDFDNLGDAINAVGPGDIVEIQSTAFVGNANFGNNAVDVTVKGIGSSPPSLFFGPFQELQFDSATGVVFDNVRFELGNNDQIVVKDGVELTFQNVEVESAGGFLRFEGISEVTFSDSVVLSGGESVFEADRDAVLNLVRSDFANVRAGRGGVVNMKQGAALLVDDCTFSDIFVDNKGGSIHLEDPISVEIGKSTFTRSAAQDEGGAVYIDQQNGSQPIVIDDCLFDDNEADKRGGAVHIRSSQSAVVSNSIFSNNRTFNDSGGGLHFQNGQNLTVEDSTFSNNSAQRGGGVVFSGSGQATILRNLFCKNAALNGNDDGGGLFVDDGSSEIANNRFAYNAARRGGGVRVQGFGTDANVRNNTFVMNDANSQGSAVSINGNGNGSLVNNLFAHQSGQAFVDLSGSSYAHSYNLYFNGDPGVGPGQGAVLGQDPLFADFTDDGDCSNDDLGIVYGSPAIDAGDPSIDDPDSTRSDIGYTGGPDAGPAVDADGDGHARTTDCDDSDPGVNPAASEVCDSVDNNCNGQTDEDSAVDAATWYRDADVDGFGNPSSTTKSCSQPNGYKSDNSDCNDSNADVNPGAQEICNGVDDDCNGQVDDNASGDATWYADGDGDGLGNPAVSQDACSQPSGYVDNADDCNDNNSNIGEAPEWFSDGDNDDFGVNSLGYQCIAPNASAPVAGDCNDNNANINPDATETCNGADDDCDGQTDEAGASGEPTWYLDADSDSYGKPSNSVKACNQPSGRVSNPDDCDDTDADINPDGTEVCNNKDDDCDGSVDNGATDVQTYYRDADGDTYGNAGSTKTACSKPSGYVADDQDCDDTASSVKPGGTEVCNNKDDDCDGTVDNNANNAATWYRDSDNDDFGQDGVTVSSCSQPNGYAGSDGDCSDSDDTVYPGAPELCDEKDNDCDGVVDDGTQTRSWYLDADNDNFGLSSDFERDCNPIAGRVTTSGDCDDTRADVNPGADEVCDGVDNDCDTVTDESSAVDAPTWYADADADDYGDPTDSTKACSEPFGRVSDGTDCDDGRGSVNPGASEVCNDLDDDCNDVADDGLTTNSWYLDDDADGFGLLTNKVVKCGTLPGRSTTPGDCDDGDDAINPDATEVCNGVDDDCSGQIDGADAEDATTYYRDADGDNVGVGSTTKKACSRPSGYANDSGDCDDLVANVYPGATELCDSADNDCDGQVDEGVSDADWFADLDNDGFGDESDVVRDCKVVPGRITRGEDCNDNAVDINPDATEVCDSVDNDCDGEVDGAGAADVGTWYGDADNDGFGRSSAKTIACTRPSGSVSQSGDCDDGQASINPAADEVCNAKDDDCDGQADEGLERTDWYADSDGDTYGDPGDVVDDCKQPAGRVARGLDCVDTDPDVNVDAVESCNGKDDDCDGLTDDASAIDTRSWYRDIDGDGVGQTNKESVACNQAAGYVSLSGDCDDTNNTVYLGAPELCDFLDNDCDGAVDDGVVDQIWYLDFDGDGYGDPDDTEVDCNRPDGKVLKGGDCDDSDADRSPGVPERCNAIDDDCDGELDEGAAIGASTWYLDGDGDGFGNQANLVQTACTQPGGFVGNNYDCDDNDATANPESEWYLDADADGFGTPDVVTRVCVRPFDHVGNTQDCNDTDFGINPLALDRCGDGLDADCDGTGGPDSDEDNDGVTWNEEDPAGSDACDPDSDGDGLNDGEELFDDNGAVRDTDGDGIIDVLDDDDDDDGMPTELEETGDTDGDGIIDARDSDDDGDGVDSSEEWPLGDTDGDGIDNALDDDDDNDGVPTAVEPLVDTDGDGIPPYLDPDEPGTGDADADGDGLTDVQEVQIGTDPDDPDSDGDGVSDFDEVGDPNNPLDSDGDGDIDALDGDDDNDGRPTELEGTDDPDGDGIPNHLDNDSDGDGVADGAEGNGDADEDGIDDAYDTEYNGDELSPSTTPVSFGLGCSTGGGPGPLGAFGLALPLLLARRRRCTAPAHPRR